MCLIARHFFPKISFKPIKVYKMILEDKDGKLETAFRHSKLLKRAKGIFFLPKRIGPKLYVEKGMIHAFSTKEKALFVRQDYIMFNHYINNLNVRIITAYIPPFTRYYIGEYGDICAKRMRYETI